MSIPNDQFWNQTVFPSGVDNAHDYFGTSLIGGDFNGDGRGDLAIGTPNEDVGGDINTGKVNVLQGSSTGLTSTGSQLWKQDNLAGSSTEAYDRFGETLISGDFNGDGYDDLAVGTPDEDWESTKDTGMLNIIYGSYFGLTSTGNQYFIQITFPEDSNEQNDRFGSSLAAGDFDGDGYDDLAIGTPYEDYDGKSNTGKVNTLYGSATGLTTTGNQLWLQSAFSGGFNNEGDLFGSSLAAGDFDGDGYDDLAIGAPFENYDGNTNTGKVNTLYGSATGLTTTGNQLWLQSAFSGGFNNEGDLFGSSLAAGDFDGDGYDDLAIGAPFENYDGNTNTGKVNTLYGSATGLTTTGNQLWTQDDLIDSNPERSDRFGTTLAVGDFNNDGYDDLAVGSPYEDINSITDGGAVNIIYGSVFGLTTTGNQFWSQDSFGVKDIAEEYDNFGASLGVQDFNGDGYDDLAIGVPGEDLGGILDSGATQILYGSVSGLVVESSLLI
ncbi:hypothetical protein [Moorena producens]|uniref:hypothetical protein n=1 Tax=Moorena producens TaxID=1155739 RepID=UPI003C7823EA